MLICLSVNARHAPLEVREHFAFQPEELADIGRLLSPHVAEAFVLGTCQRFEAYVIPYQPMAGECLAGLFAQYRQVEYQTIVGHTETYTDRTATAHLFRVAAGLESQVLGESQILGQLRRALDASRLAGLTEHRLASLVQQAIGAGRRVRDETALGRGALSVSSVAVDYARQLLGDLTDRRVLLVGAGETAQLAAKALSPARQLTVVNRTAARARALAAQCDGEARPWSELPAAVAAADLVLCCVGADQAPLSRQVVARARREQAGRALLLVDLAMPRGIDPAVAELPGVRLIELDDLLAASTAHQAERLAAVPAAEGILAPEIERAWRTLEGSAARPAITALRARAEAIRLAELARIAPRLTELPPDQAAAVDYLTRAIVNKLLHPPTVWLKSHPVQADGTLRELFGVGVLP